MFARHSIVTLALLAWAPGSWCANLAAADARRVDALVEAAMQAESVPGVSVAVARDGAIVHARGYGFADLENRVPVDAHTRIRTASIAKWMTAVAALRLAEQGKLDLDAPVQKYCAAYPASEWRLTSRHLLAHTGGVRQYRGDNGEPQDTEEQRRALQVLIDAEQASQYTRYTDLVAPVAVFRNDPLLFEPGTRYHYTSFGYRLLGCALEGVAGSYRTLMKDTVFGPAGMKETVEDDAWALIEHRAAGYYKPENEALRRADFRDVSDNLPAGGYLSTASDLVRFALAFDAGKLLSPASRERMLAAPDIRGEKIDASNYYGLGVRVALRPQVQGRRVLSHSGGQSGASTHLILLPAEHLAVAVMMNQEEGAADTLAYAIASSLLK